MNQVVFESLRKRAKELHAAQDTKNRVSLDAIFTTLALDGALSELMKSVEPQKVRKTSEEQPPDWFVQTLAKLKGTGEKATVSRFLMLAGKFPAQRSDALAVGRWLRESGFVPRKTGGNIIFEF